MSNIIKNLEEIQTVVLFSKNKKSALSKTVSKVKQVLGENLQNSNFDITQLKDSEKKNILLLLDQLSIVSEPNFNIYVQNLLKIVDTSTRKKLFTSLSSANRLSYIQQKAQLRNEEIITCNENNVRSYLSVKCLKHKNLVEIRLDNYSSRDRVLDCCCEKKRALPKLQIERQALLLQVAEQRGHEVVVMDVATTKSKPTLRCRKHNVIKQVGRLDHYISFVFCWITR